jgi:glycosyltransferase involved in cell wall biosynthesis
MMVDVIMPVYNPGPYLDEAIRSCLNQSYGDLSLVVVDDCSSQDVFSVVKKYDSIKYIRNEKNMGPAYSRNIGIESSSGDLVSCLDADDVWDREKLAYSVSEFDKNKAIGMTCGNYRIMANGRLQRPFYRSKININHEKLMLNNYVASGSVTVKRAVLSEVGLFNEKYWIAEDYDLWIRVSEIYPIKYIHKILYYYRILPNGSSLTQRSDIQSKHIDNLNKIKKDSMGRLALKNGRGE